MRPSRGMGIINPAKIGKKLPKKITRKDDPDEVDGYKRGGSTKLLGPSESINLNKKRIAGRTNKDAYAIGGKLKRGK